MWLEGTAVDGAIGKDRATHTHAQKQIQLLIGPAKEEHLFF